MQKPAIPVALTACASYTEEDVTESVYACLEATAKDIPANSKILVKPNFLTANKLACTHPLVITAVCAWLLENGHKPFVADSPAFGTARKIATFLGVDNMLKKIGVPLKEMSKPAALALKLWNGKHEIIKISEEVLAADVIFSLPKIKAHSQMGMTLAVKNCFGCVPGVRKALLHNRHGNTHEEFASWLAALWQALPSTQALCDGVICMSETGPARGKAYNLGLIAACKNAQLLDQTILDILGISLESVPLTNLIAQKFSTPITNYPLASPQNFNGKDFKMPVQLKSASFSVGRLVKSFLRRWLAARKHK